METLKKTKQSHSRAPQLSPQSSRTSQSFPLRPGAVLLLTGCFGKFSVKTAEESPGLDATPVLSRSCPESLWPVADLHLEPLWGAADLPSHVWPAPYGPSDTALLSLCSCCMPSAASSQGKWVCENQTHLKILCLPEAQELMICVPLPQAARETPPQACLLWEGGRRSAGKGLPRALPGPC